MVKCNPKKLHYVEVNGHMQLETSKQVTIGKVWMIMRALVGTEKLPERMLRLQTKKVMPYSSIKTV
jgi:hypothetical protein